MDGGKKLWFGPSGGHDDYFGNETAVVDLVNRTISNIYPPSCFNYSGSGTSPCAFYDASLYPTRQEPGYDKLPNGSPASRHTYNGLQCVDRKATCYAFSGAAAYIGAFSRYMWEWPYSGTVATNWVQTTEWSTTAANPSNMNIHDFPTKNLMYVDIDGAHLYSYNYTSHAWTFIHDFTNAGLAPFFSTSLLDDSRQRLVFVGGNDPYAGAPYRFMGWVDVSGNDGTYTYHDVTPQALATCGPLIFAVHPGIAFDPNDNKYVAKGMEGTTVYTIDPDSWTCTSDNPSGGPANVTSPAETPAGLSNGLFGRWQYSAALNKFVTLNDYNQNVFAYQRDYGLGRSTAVCVDRDGDGYGTGQTAIAPLTDLVIASGGAVPSPPSASVVGTAGGTTYYYFLSECYNYYKNCSAMSTASSAVTNANAVLNGSNYVRITWPDGGQTYVLTRSTTSTPPTGNVTAQVAGAPSCNGTTCTVLDQSNTVYPVGVGLSQNLTSASHPFTSADFGKTIHITSGAGFTLVGDFTIQSVSGGVATVNGVVGLAGTTGGHWQFDGCLGPDADDLDASVHTDSDAVSKWGTRKAFLQHQGYVATNYWYVDPISGSDANTCHDTDATSASTTPCQSWGYVNTHGFAAGDMVLFRGGHYTENLGGGVGSGSAGAYRMLKAFPGEEPIFNTAIDTVDQHYVIIDGLTNVCGNSTGSSFTGGTDDYQSSSLFHDNYFRHMRSTNCSNGFYQFNGMENITYEDNVLHDHHGTSGHGIYIGSRELPNKNILVQRNLSYNNDYTGMQHNGRVTGALIQQNMFHSNIAAGLSLEEGFAHSTIRSNLFFNGHNASLVWAIYDYDRQNECPTASPTVSGICDCTQANSAHCPNDQNFNLIENNSFYMGGFDRDGNAAPTAAVNYGTQNLASLTGNATGPFDTTVNHSLAATIDGTPYTFTLTSGASRTLTQVIADINGVLPGVASSQLSNLKLTSLAAPNTQSTIVITASATRTLLGMDNPYNHSNPPLFGPSDTGFPKDVGNNTYRSNSFYAGTGVIGGGPDSYPPIAFNDTTSQWLSTSVFDHNIMRSIASGTDPIVLGWGFCTITNGCSTGWLGKTCADLASMTTFPNGTSADCKNVDPQYTAASPTYYNSPTSFNFLPALGSPAISSGSTITFSPSDNAGTAFNNPPNIGGISGTPAPPSCALAPGSLGPYTAGQVVSRTFTPSNCSSSTCSISAGSLGSSGLSLGGGSNCVLAGTAVAGSYSFTVAYDTTGNAISLTINAAPAITSSGALAAGTQGSAYSQSIGTSGGTAPITCALFSGSLAGSGLTVNSNCTITGTAGTPATYTLTIKGTDSNSITGAASGSLTITINAPSTCNITPTTLGPWTVGTAPGSTLTANSCGGGTLTWTCTGMPAGTSCSGTGTSKAVAGTPTTAASYTPTISLTDGGSNTASISPTIVVNGVSVTGTRRTGGQTKSGGVRK